ncbi:MAG: alanine--tRNA ligase [Gammaproteobacteria bacterium]|nr:alanine--tRNA ligase [Gammaproteobacteria bacterium]
MKTADIRRAFLAFFHERGHEIVPSSSLVPGNDPTLLFTNAGMVQFKEVFLGLEDKPYRRAVSVQRCVRAGGKHNDLENVGYTARHHTLFEMLGFFSFGDYFKREAIHFAWEFLTVELKLPAEKLWITVYKDDEEAAAIWLNEVGVSPDRFSRCGDADNFWAMGDTGPCGPCTEIFYDHGPSIAGGPPGSPDADGDRYIEIWNLVFMQYNRDKSGTLHPLPSPSVDTGMGLERIAAVVQGVHNNYDIDDFQTLIQAIVKLAPTANVHAASLKVVADHLRASICLIADGVLPSNEGRGYVLRRIIRRAIRHAHQLGITSPFFATLLPAVIPVMGEVYPLIGDKKIQIAEILTREESQFAKTLEQGLRLLQDELKTMVATNTLFSGETAFKLYDTYGFPLDLTEDILREKGMTVERAAFETCMEAQRTQSQANTSFAATTTHFDPGTAKSEFHGYEKTLLSASILTLLVNGAKKTHIQQGEAAVIILDATPFYAESGGQVGDTGVIQQGDARFVVSDTQRLGQVILHHGEVQQGQFSVGDTVESQVDEARRHAIRLNHTATHLLHAALKQILGDSVEQKGSLVEAQRARFDFSYDQAVAANKLVQIEQLVNQKIRDNHSVATEVMPLEDSRRLGAVALFGEKYGEAVRVLTVGEFSKELCGGTHAQRTGDIGYFKITAEYGIANGVRRIELVTGLGATQWVDTQLGLLDDIALLLKTNRAESKNKVFQVLNDIKDQEKQLGQMRQKLAHHTSGALVDQVETINHVPCLVAAIEGVDMQGLRTMLDSLKDQLKEAVMVLYTVAGDRMNVVAFVSPSLLGRVPTAPALASCLCDKAGGRDGMAQGGGAVPDDLADRLKKLKNMINGNDSVKTSSRAQ